jgi:hypothetical protein
MKAAHNNGMQSDKNARYALILAADVGRYAIYKMKDEVIN